MDGHAGDGRHLFMMYGIRKTTEREINKHSFTDHVSLSASFRTVASEKSGDWECPTTSAMEIVMECNAHANPAHRGRGSVGLWHRECSGRCLCAGSTP
jgi:hypothetical protein